MKKLLLIIILKICTINLILANEELAELRFYFFPAFISQSEFVFKSEKLELIIDKPFFKWQELDFDRIEDDTSNYLPSKTNQFQSLNHKISSINFADYKRKPHRYYDGISIEITKIFKNGKEEKLEFDCPSRDEYKVEYEILDEFFDLLDNIEFKGNQRNYVERLKSDYFDYGLLIKQVNSNPLEFRIYGGLNSNNKTELKQFFKSLPSNESIIFDMRNCGFMGTMFHKYFRRLNRNKEIYYLLESKEAYPTKEIKNCKAIISREEIK